MPQVGDIVRTRYCVEQWGRNVQVTFWWRLLSWSPQQSLEEFLFAVALQWLAAVDELVDETYVIRLGKFRNLSRSEPDYTFSFAVTGQPKPSPVRAVSASLYIQRYGIDVSGSSRRSPIILSNLVLDQTGGRLSGSGFFPSIHEFLTETHSIISPTHPIFVGGFISRLDGSFVETTGAWMNPVIFSLKTRTRAASTREVFA
jgi:hypothetical protein